MPCLVFPFSTRNMVFGKKCKSMDWFLYDRNPRNERVKLKFCTYLEYAEFNGEFHFFSVLDWTYPFWRNLPQKIKIMNLSWNLAPRIIGGCRIQRWCLLFCFGVEIFLRENLVQKLKSGKSNLECKSMNSLIYDSDLCNERVQLKFCTETNSICRVQCWISLFYVLDQIQPFWANLLRKIKIMSFSWHIG